MCIFNKVILIIWGFFLGRLSWIVNDMKNIWFGLLYKLFVFNKFYFVIFISIMISQRVCGMGFQYRRSGSATNLLFWLAFGSLSCFEEIGGGKPSTYSQLTYKKHPDFFNCRIQVLWEG